MFRRVKGDVWGGETWSLAQSTLSFRTAKPKRWENEEWWMKSEESVFTLFNLSFITFPRQLFVGFFHVIFPLKEGIPICNHFLHSNQSMNTRPCSGGLKDQQPYIQRQRLGLYMPCNNFAPEGQKHFPPNDNAFALSGRRLLCYPCSLGCCPGLMAHCPFQGRIRH